MTTVILLRHARSSANGSGVLAGRSARVGLDERGREQARAIVDRFDGVTLAGAVRSPLLRCRQTLAPLLSARDMRGRSDTRFSEVDYGEWTGREISSLAKEPLWRVVQSHPSGAVFPGGEGLAAVQARAVAAIRSHDERIAAERGQDAVWVVCSHGDVLKSILADALGMHLDSFQRIVVDPCSVSVVHYTETRPFVVRMNDHGSDLVSIMPSTPKRRGRRSRKPSSDATVGGSSGAG